MDRLELKRLQILQALEATRFSRQPEPLRVCHIMTESPTAVNEQTTVLELVRLLHRHGFRHLLVTDATGSLAGVLSDRDVIRCFGPEHKPDERRLAWITAGEIMSRDLITISPGARIDVAIDLIVSQGISCLPVLEGDTIRGIITNTDLNLLLQLVLKTSPVHGNAESARRATLVPQN